jgi:secreted PhoX family phosphatase
MIRSADKRVAAGDYRSRELCGACFDPTGDTLFVNLQIPGITFAIWGPWANGNL